MKYYRLMLQNTSGTETYLRLSSVLKSIVEYEDLDVYRGVNIISSTGLDILTVPAITISSIDDTITQYTQERATTEAYYGYGFIATETVVSATPKINRQMSINTTGSILTYVYIYTIKHQHQAIRMLQSLCLQSIIAIIFYLTQ